MDLPEEIDGAALETLVIQHLRAWVAYRQDREKIYFWRSRGGAEVELILYGEKSIWAIEVKNSSKIRGEDLRGLSEFAKDYPQAIKVMVYRGNHRELIDGTLCLPATDFVQALDPARDLEI